MTRHDAAAGTALRTSREEYALIADAIRRARGTGGPLRILEAGCGRRWNIDMGSREFHLVGVDLDADALRARMENHGDLDEAVVGDLRSVELPPESFDVVYCSYVLEHLEGAELVLERFLRVLRPGGLLVVAIPDGGTVFGFVTSHTPHWVHVAFKRYVRGNRNAGCSGFGPYPTVYDPVVSSAGMRDFAHRHALSVRVAYRTCYYLNTFGRFAPAVQQLLSGIAWLSHRRLTATHNNVGFVLEKPYTGSAAGPNHALSDAV